MIERLLLLVLITGFQWGCSPRPDVHEHADTKKPPKQIDYIARIGVVSLTPDVIPLAETNLPLGFYKDYSCFGRENVSAESKLMYMPVIQS